jgi:hypothetical protein
VLGGCASEHEVAKGCNSVDLTVGLERRWRVVRVRWRLPHPREGDCGEDDPTRLKAREKTTELMSVSPCATCSLSREHLARHVPAMAPFETDLNGGTIWTC